MVLRVCMVLLLLSLSVELVAASAARQQVRTALRSFAQDMGKQADKVKRFALRTGIAVGTAAILTGAAVLPVAAHHNFHLKDVHEGSPAQFKSVFYLVSKGDTHDDQSYHAVAYIGNDEHGNALLMGEYTRSMVKKASEEGGVGLALYGYDGVIMDGVELEEIGYYPELRGHTEVSVYTVRGLNLSMDYMPLDVRMFPLDKVGEEVNMITYWHDYEHDHHYDLPAIWRSCEIVPSVWNKIGVGGTTCAPVDAWFSLVLLAETGQIIGFRQGQSREEDVVLVAGINRDLVEFVRKVQNKPYAVSAGGKLPTSWARIKSGQ